MSLQDIEIKGEYRSLVDNIAVEFYIPILKQSKNYKRAVGFFSSSMLIDIMEGIDGLVENGGNIQIVASPRLSEDDIIAINKGYEIRKIIENALTRELHEHIENEDKIKLNYLSSLIANRMLDIKIAFLEKNGEIGMYHEKMGIIEDSDLNVIAFSGSMNDSYTAMHINYETIDVFKSWSESEEIRERVRNKQIAFERIWNNNENKIKIIDFPNLKNEIIKKYKLEKSNDYDNNINTNTIVINEKTDVLNGARLSDNIQLYDYQNKAIKKWEEQEYCGIFDMATGTGKTFTGLAAVAKLSEYLEDRFAVIIVCPYQHLVEQWAEDMPKFNIHPIIGYSSSQQRKWKKMLAAAIRKQKLGVKNREFFTFICTNATFKSEFVQNQINKINSDVLLLVDEAHNFGAAGIRNLLDERFKYRLALSATIDRFRDEVGTEKIYNFFGNKCIKYSLEQAIEEKKLTPYKYFPIIITLAEDEREKYMSLSYEMSRNMITGKNGKVKLSKYGEMLAIQRSRIVAGAKMKIESFIDAIKPYKNDDSILVYCGAANVIDYEKSILEVDEADLRQIDVITKILGDELKMKVSQYTSKEDINERKVLKEEFKKKEHIQALIAIKCLDEGVNIPSIKTAFILASTTNPKEYIQRRGRVLRLSEGKEFAKIYDFVTLPRELDEVSALTEDEMTRDISLVKKEILRMEEFSRISINKFESDIIIDNIRENYHMDIDNKEL